MIEKIGCFSICCDGCDEEFTIDGDSVLRCDNIEDTRRCISDDGWISLGYKVFCPACSAKLDDGELKIPAMFHSHSGYYFERIDLDRVKITKINEKNSIKEFEVIFDADTWCSIMASVSAIGENGETFGMAENLHKGIAEGKKK